ncbi:MAG TPA: chemotaxis protein CheW [Thermoanaerobaculia bacterium]|nr:chemotaxis protein CheW [Thermoanaerobaculia bacterium]
MTTQTELPPAGLAEDVLPYTPVDGRQALYAFADSVSAEPQVAQKPTRLEMWVTFELAGEIYALPVSHVMEILRVAGITRVPQAPRVIRGVTNMRGKVLPIVDLRVRLGVNAAEITSHSRILVVSSRGRLLGLLVDSVLQVERIDLLSVQPPPPDVMTAQSDYLIGVCQLGPRLVVLLDVGLVLVLTTTSEGE